MKIWADADALPGPIRDILFRAAQRTENQLVLVANKRLRIPVSRYVKFEQVRHGADVADGFIVESMEAGDLVITADIPLAALVVEKGGLALDPRGELYSEDNIGERLAMRNLMQELRSEGMKTGGPRPMDKRARQDFANALDRILSREN
ncbi:YaiI/YqxD family protein [bacterium]|nr:MAG: YaiI/YqxD family protein [bacterium]